MDEPDQEDIYRWEGGYEKTWEGIKEDEQGSLESSILDFINKAKRKRLAERQGSQRLGMMRHVFIVLDLSKSMTLSDLFPTRQEVTIKLLDGFVDEFFDQNPIGQLGVIATKDKRSERSCELTGNARKLKGILQKLLDASCSGEPSLQNSLEMSMSILKNMPSHASREVLIVMGSLTTCDPSNILVTIEKLARYKIRCSFIGLGAEVRLFRRLCEETNGEFGVALGEAHFKELLSSQSLPPPSEITNDSNLIKMGFCTHKIYTGGPDDAPSMCVCHSESNPKFYTSHGYFCPQCGSKYCEIPVECKICGLTLVSAPHIARSYHHLFPLRPFRENRIGELKHCTACMHKIEYKMYSCEECESSFCVDCDVFIHETLHTCPGCASKSS